MKIRKIKRTRLYFLVESGLWNKRYEVEVDDNGIIQSITWFDDISEKNIVITNFDLRAIFSIIKQNNLKILRDDEK